MERWSNRFIKADNRNKFFGRSIMLINTVVDHVRKHKGRTGKERADHVLGDAHAWSKKSQTKGAQSRSHEGNIGLAFHQVGDMRLFRLQFEEEGMKSLGAIMLWQRGIGCR